MALDCLKCCKPSAAELIAFGLGSPVCHAVSRLSPRRRSRCFVRRSAPRPPWLMHGACDQCNPYVLFTISGISLNIVKWRSVAPTG
jgi:hypothetical protein